MLSSLTLEGFRSCTDPTTLKLAPLTILAGANNTGKSSFVGALLSLVQSIQARSGELLLLNGHWVDLGPFSEILSPDRESVSIGIEGRWGNKDVSVLWDLRESSVERRARAEARVARIVAVHGEERAVWERSRSRETYFVDPTFVLQIESPPPRHNFPFFPDQVRAVGPYRIAQGDLASYRVGDEGSLVGKYGQYATEAFWAHRDLLCDVLPPVVGEAAEGPRTVSKVMGEWWRYILNEDVAIRVEEIVRHGYSVRVDTRSISNRSFGQVGFGLSQLWPILVAGLTSSRGGLVVVDTPEAHLHPGAQHRTAEMLVQLARAGRQVIVETHSEHVVAAACLALKRGLLKPADLALTYFSQPDGHTRLERIEVHADGRRLSAPEGFFDQSMHELLALMEPS